MVNNGIVNKMYKIKKKRQYQEKPNALFFTNIENDCPLARGRSLCDLKYNLFPGRLGIFVDYDLRKQEELENRLASAALPRRSVGSIASSGQSSEIPSLLRRPGTMQGPLFSGSSCPSEHPENQSNNVNQSAHFFK